MKGSLLASDTVVSSSPLTSGRVLTRPVFLQVFPSPPIYDEFDAEKNYLLSWKIYSIPLRLYSQTLFDPVDKEGALSDYQFILRFDYTNPKPFLPPGFCFPARGAALLPRKNGGTDPLFPYQALRLLRSFFLSPSPPPFWKPIQTESRNDRFPILSPFIEGSESTFSFFSFP